MAEWSFFEAMVENGIWGLASLKEGYRRPITSGMMIRQRLQVLGVLAHKRFGDSTNSRKNFDEIIAQAVILVGLRNDIVHSDWVKSGHPDKSLGRRFKYAASGPGRRKRIQFIPVEKSAEEIESLADQISSLANDLVSLLTALGVFPAT